ncbi:MAG: pantoate--beta-alanine ligase [Desulfobacterales bacterium]
MDIITTAKEFQCHADAVRAKGSIIGFVPTMGFLHEGHLMLLREARKQCDELVLSIFVNPTQFGPNEDFETYPRNLERDIELARKESVNTVFHPKAAELYGPDFQTYINLEKLPEHLCGLSRPGFFRGVATVVSKLFNIIKPHIAFFGQKDYQQLAVIRRMVGDLNFDIRIVGVPTVREPDGLAMSSRNAYLSDEQRPAALSLYHSLQNAENALKKGCMQADEIISEAADRITSYPDTRIDYITICDPDTLEDVPVITRPVLMALAVMVGKTRLIDNKILVP